MGSKQLLDDAAQLWLTKVFLILFTPTPDLQIVLVCFLFWDILGTKFGKSFQM